MPEKRKCQGEVSTEFNVFHVPFEDALHLAKIGNGRTYEGAHVFNIQIGNLELKIFVDVYDVYDASEWEAIEDAVKGSPFAVKGG